MSITTRDKVVDKWQLTFDDGESAPLGLLPAGTHQPPLDLLHQHGQILRVALHDLIKFGELSRPEEYLGQTELKLLVV